MRKLAWLAGTASLGAVVATLTYVVSCVDNGNVDVTCPRYCQDMATTCTDIDQQYADDNTCKTFCAVMNPGEAGIGGSDTVACRDLSASNAKDDPTAADKHTDCVNAGPSSGVCGPSQCAAFCALTLSLCGPSRTGYPDTNACETACATWGTSFDGKLIGSTGNTLQCRTYHLQLSQTGNANDLETHCPHTGVVSARCFDAVPDAGSDAATDAPTSDAAGD